MVFSTNGVAVRSSYLATFSEGNLTHGAECALTVAFRTKMVLEAWVARIREGSRWLRNFILAAELVDRRGMVGMDRELGEVNRGSYIPFGVELLHIRDV